MAATRASAACVIPPQIPSVPNLSGLYEPVPKKPPITTGGYGTVQLSRRIGRPTELVAVKTLRYSDDDSANEALNKALQKELAPLLVACEHRNIVKCLGIVYNEDNGTHAIVVSYFPRGTLTRLLPEIQAADRLRVIIDVAKGLCFLHTPRAVKGYTKLEIAHGDLHPGNVLIDTDGTAVLADFGLCKLVESGTEPSMSARTNGPAGTALYTAPELHTFRKVEGKPEYEYTARRSLVTDMFAFGMLMFVVLGGDPDLGPTSLTIATALLEGRRPLRNTGPARISDGHWDVIMKCWAHQPAARPAIGDVLRSLR